MGYIGNEPTTGHFPVQTNLAGDGSTRTFTLTNTPASASAIEVSVAGVLQPTTAYSVVGTTLTLPISGTVIANTIPIFIRYLGETLSLPTPADGSVTDAKIADMSATKLTGTIDNARISLDAAEIPSLATSKITTGTFDVARISAASVTQHVPPVDLTAVRQDIAMLALYNSVSDNRAAYNLPFSFIDTFQDDTGVTTKTDVSNVDEYFGSVSGGGVDSYVKLMLHMDDTGLIDSSASPLTTTKVGQVTRSGTQSKFGSYSAYFDGAGDELNITAGSAVNFANADWTVDFWWRPNAVNTQYALFAGQTDNTRIAMRFADDANQNMFVYYIGGIWTIRKGAKVNFAANTWYHTALTRHGNAIYMYHDGVLDYTGTMTAAPNTESNNIRIGRWGGGQFNYAGYLDEYRVSIGISRYPSGTAFDVPTEAYAPLTTSATGTLVSDVQTAPSAVTKMSGVILYKEAYGTTTLGTQLKIYLTANLQGTSPNWTNTDWKEVVPGDFGAVTPLFSAGVKMVRIAEQTVVSGTATAMKAVWASQASSSLETQLHGWAMNY